MMNSYIKFTFIIFLVSAFYEYPLLGQEIPIYYHTQYGFNSYLINPAIAGSKDYSVLSLSARQNVEKIANAPKTQILSFHTRIPNYRAIKEDILTRGTEFTNIGLGGYIYNDVSGPLRKIGFQVTYAYHVPLSKKSISHLAFGLSFNGFIYSINYGELNTLRDPLIDEGSKQAFVPDANFGVYYYDQNVFAGISAAQLFETSISWKSDKYNEIPISRNYFLLVGYRFLIKRNILIEPSIFVKTNDEDIAAFYKNIDVNLRVYYSTFSVAVSYRMNEGIVFMGQYQYPMSEIWNYNYGIAEIVAGLNLGQGKNRFGDSRYW